jgi:hypothetical protein
MATTGWAVFNADGYVDNCLTELEAQGMALAEREGGDRTAYADQECPRHAVEPLSCCKYCTAEDEDSEPTGIDMLRELLTFDIGQ